MSSIQKGGLEVQGLEILRPGFKILADLNVGPEERVALVGRSGCGKTTVLRAIAGLESTEQGKVRVAGQDWTGVRPEDRRFGFVFQDLALFPALTVGQNLEFGLRVLGVPPGERKSRIAVWADRFGLRGREHDSIGQLSGGERQRVALIRTWVTRPRILLLDEPFSALDSALRSEFRSALAELLSAEPVPLLWVTHDSSDLDAFATRRVEVQETQGGKLREFRG